MRKWISIFFLFIFGITNTGFSIDIHFCDNQITDIALFDEAVCICDEAEEITTKHCCAVEEQINHKQCNSTHHKFSEHKNCCENQKVIFKKVDFQTTLATKKIFFAAIQLPSIQIFELKSEFYYSPIFTASNFSKIPPNKQAINCVWRI